MRGHGISTASFDVIYREAEEGKENAMDLLSNAGLGLLVSNVYFLMLFLFAAGGSRIYLHFFLCNSETCYIEHHQCQSLQLFGADWIGVPEFCDHFEWHS